MQKITPFLWFDTAAEEAMKFYTSVFKNSQVLGVNRAGPDGPVISVEFELNGQKFMGLNAGPQFKFNEAVSFFVDCDSQQEVDELWGKLLAGGGSEGRCGWIQDKFGLWWQIIPKLLTKLMGDPNPVKAQAAMQAMLKMNKIESKVLQAAYDQA